MTYDLFNPPPVTERYHNTTHLQGAELEAREMRANAQCRVILEYFRKHPDESFTPYQVMRALNFGPFQLQSVRRSLTNLTQCREHYLRMTGEKRIGESGEKNNVWALNNSTNQLSYTMTFAERQKKFNH